MWKITLCRSVLRENPFFNKHSSKFVKKNPTQPKPKQNISQEKKENPMTQIHEKPVLQDQLTHTNL